MHSILTLVALMGCGIRPSAGDRLAASKVGFSYVTELTLSFDNNGTEVTSMGDFILDTSSYTITALFDENSTALEGECLNREVDLTDAIFYSDENECLVVEGQATLGSITVDSAPISVATNIVLENPVLHQWNLTNGVLGLGYNQSHPGGVTSFQKMLADGSASGEMLFGLDLNAAGEPSYLDLNDLSPEYKDAMVWSELPPTRYPAEHSFFVDHLAFCGQDRLLTNWSTSWPVVVDAGSSCLTLPSEIYHTFIKYLNQTGSYFVGGKPILPSLRFKMTSLASQEILTSFGTSFETNNATFSIYLENLIVDDGAIQLEPGAPFIFDGNGDSIGRLCVLKGSSIHPPAAERFYTPPIVFGALALNSLYFAADMNTGQVGLAQKPDSAAAARAEGAMCIPLEQCIGQDRFDPSLNSCGRAECAKYFYSTYNEDEGDCSLDQAALAIGLIFLISCILMEIWSYLLVHIGNHYLNSSPGSLFGTSRRQQAEHRSHSSWKNAISIEIVIAFMESCVALFMDVLLAVSDFIVFTVGYAARAPGGGEATAAEDTRIRSRSTSNSLRSLARNRNSSGAVPVGAAGDDTDTVWGARYVEY